jgi:hypothetical protein
MNNIHTFKKLDKLIEGLDIIGLSDKEDSLQPEGYKKWTKGIKELPEKERKEYMQTSYDKAKQERKTKAEHKEQILQTLPYPQSDLAWHHMGEDLDIKKIEKLNNNGIIREEVESVFFSFKQSHKKSIDLGYFDWSNSQVKDTPENQSLYYPEEVTIDYSEYCDITKFKHNIFAKPYKDGIMLVGEVDRGNTGLIALSVGTVEKSTNVEGKVVAKIFSSAFRNYGQIDWTHKNFDEQVVFYVVIPKIVKNKALRIIFKNNTRLNKLIKLFREHAPLMLPPGKFRHFYDDTATMNDVMATLLLCQEDEKYKKHYNYSDKELLYTGYKSALVELSNTAMDASDNGFGPEDFWTPMEGYKKKSLEEIKQEYMKDIFPFEKDLEFGTLQNLNNKDKRWGIYFKKNFLKMAVFYYHTNKGTTLCDNNLINIENKTEPDCLLFWKKIDLFELLFNVLNKKNSPLCIEDSKIINDVNIFDPLLNTHISLAPVSETSGNRPGAKPGNKIGKKTFNFKYKHILEESVNNATGYLVPYDGVFELLHDPIFKGIRFREEGDLVTAVILDRNERHFVEVFSKTEVDFKYMFWNRIKYNTDYSEDCMQEIYKKIAIVIRDSHVLIDREITMGGGGKRRPYGMNTDSEYNIYYFPRKRYRYKNNTKAEKDFFRESRKFSGTRVAHLRRLPADYAPSDKQKLLAKSLGWHVPSGHTFVKETDWGVKMTKRETKYRHTGLNDLFYFGSNEVSEAQKINQLPDGMAFEEYCQDYVKKLGYSTKSRQNYDGGIDIRATKILDNGETEYLIVQCKKWNKPVSPGAMKEFKASCDEEQSEYKKVKIFMTSNKFSPGARKYAEKYNIKLIDGSDLIANEKDKKVS